MQPAARNLQEETQMFGILASSMMVATRLDAWEQPKPRR